MFTARELEELKEFDAAVDASEFSIEDEITARFVEELLLPYIYLRPDYWELFHTGHGKQAWYLRRRWERVVCPALRVEQDRRRREWRKKHPEQLERQREYTRTHKEQEAERKREWYQKNKERIAQQQKLYSYLHQEQVRERKRLYRQSHQEQVREQARKRYHAKKESRKESGTGVSP